MEPGSAETESLFREADQVFASELLEAETRSAGARKGLSTVEVDDVLKGLKLVQPERSLTHELKTILSMGYPLKGADLWHLACALYFAGDPSTIPFLTLDKTQAQAAASLGFKVLPGPSMTPSGVQEAPPRAYQASGTIGSAKPAEKRHGTKAVYGARPVARKKHGAKGRTGFEKAPGKRRYRRTRKA
jgi:hypothetical protein